MEDILHISRQLYQGLLRRPLPTTERSLLKEVLLSSKSKLIGLYGSRGVGKTTLMLQWLKKQSISEGKKLYISCDHAIFQDINLFEFLRYFSLHDGEIVVLDEIHYVKDFEQILKSAYDFLDLKIVFSGSSAIALTNIEFTRRFAMFHLPQLSLREYIEISLELKLDTLSFTDLLPHHLELSATIAQQLNEHRILPLFQNYLKHGGYPFYFEDPLSFSQKLNDTLNLVLQTELAPLFSIQPNNVMLLKKFLAVISRSKPIELKIEKLSREVGLSKPTIYKYLEYLERGELVRQISHEQKRFSNTRIPDKLYMFHPNLAYALSMQSDIGNMRETFFAFQLASAGHKVEFISKGDFLVDEEIVFEVGGKNKSKTQIKDVKKQTFLALDNIEVGSLNRIPLWLFGFLN